jgi:hypothetical protein
MNGYVPSLIVTFAPGLTLVVATAFAALAAFSLLRQSRRGRARSAIAYLSGLLSGIAVTGVLAVTIGTIPDDNGPVIAGGLLGAFFGPFAGMLRAVWHQPARRQPRDADMLRGVSR